MVTHQVRRANFRLKMADAPDATQQEHWQREFQRRYVPLLDQALERWLQQRPHLANRVVQIPRLQLDLGELDTVDDEVLVRLLQQQLDIKVPGLLGMDADSWRLQCYFHFLQHGAWPLGSTLSGVADAEKWLLAHPGMGQRLLAHLQDSVNVGVIWQRLWRQHTRYFLDWLAARSRLLLPAEISAALDELRSHAEFRAVLSLWLGLWWQHHGKTSYYHRKDLRLALLTDLQAAIAAPDAALLGQIVKRMDDLEMHRSSLKRAAADDNQPHEESHDGDGQLEHGVLVQQAGIVLLYPFLPRLFDTLGLLDAGRFRSDQERLQALFALHYIGTGRQQADEGELALHKFLVHWPMDHAVPVSLMLEPEHYREIDHMIRTAIDEWRALKNTSLAGLRETFLQRTGSLQKLDEGYRLAITGRSVDILLAQLPWSLHVVMLPWLTKPLFIYWGKS